MEEAGFDIAMVSEKYQPFLDAYKYSREKCRCLNPNMDILMMTYAII